MKTNESMKTKEKAPVKPIHWSAPKILSIGGRNVTVVQQEPVFRKRLSAAEREERAAAILICRLLLPMADFMNETYKLVRSHFAGLNKVINENIAVAVQGVYPALSVNYGKLLLTTGTLPNAPAAAAVSSSSGKLLFTWADNSGESRTLRSDLVFVVAYCEKLNHWICCPAATTRDTGSCTLNVAVFRGEPVHTYIGFMSADRARTSDSRYAGMLNIL